VCCTQVCGRLQEISGCSLCVVHRFVAGYIEAVVCVLYTDTH